MTSLGSLVGSYKVGPRTMGLLVFGAGAADAWHFHTFGTSTDLTFIVAAASALGVHVANQASAAAKASQPPSPPNAAVPPAVGG